MKATACYFNTSLPSLHSASNLLISFAATSSFTSISTNQILLYTYLGSQAFPKISNSHQTQVQPYLEATGWLESTYPPLLGQCTPNVNQLFSSTNALTVSSLTRQIQY